MPITCVNALATRRPERAGLRWEAAPPALAPGQMLVVIAPAMLECSFPAGAHPAVITRIERRGADAVVQVDAQGDARGRFGGSAMVGSAPGPSGRVRFEVRGGVLGGGGAGVVEPLRPAGSTLVDDPESTRAEPH